MDIVPVCVKLLKKGDYKDQESKCKLFNFAIKHVPADEVDGLLHVYHKLPLYIEDRKRKHLDKDAGTCLKIQRIASQHEILGEMRTRDLIEVTCVLCGCLSGCL